jgi:hypothetical protein
LRVASPAPRRRQDEFELVEQFFAHHDVFGQTRSWSFVMKLRSEVSRQPEIGILGVTSMNPTGLS